jgi:eukaryotic-like serine/threonine-protein kinase
VPADFETIVHKAIAREPGQRYASAKALADDMNRFIEGRPIQARRVSRLERTWRWCKRNPWTASLSAALLVALVSGTIISSILATRASRQARIAETEATRARGLAGELQASLGESNRLAGDLKSSLEVSDRRRVALTFERARTNLERGQAACERGDIGPGLLYFIESWRSASEARDPGLVHAARANLSAWRHQSPRLLRPFPHTDKNGIWHVAFRPDGKAVAMAGIDKMVRLVDPITGDAIGALMQHQGVVSNLAFSPDSKTLITVDPDQKAARMWDASTGSAIGSPLSYLGSVTSVAYSPDGKTLIAVASDEKTARLWDAATGNPIGRPLTHQSGVLSLSLSPDGKTVVTTSADPAAR